MDVAKGIGIIAVVIGHMVKVDGIIGQYIWGLHMPLFFFLSGLFLKKEAPIFHLLQKRAKNLLIPCLSFTILIIVVDRYVFNDKSSSEELSFQLPDTCWFLTTLFLANIWSACLIRMVPVGFAIVLNVMIAFFCQIVNIPTWFSVSSTFVASSFLLLGYISKEMSYSNNVLCGSLLLYPLIVFVFDVHTGIKINLFGLMGLIAAFVGIIQIAYLSNVINRVGGAGLQFMTFMGRNSLVIMLTHMIFISLYCHCVNISNPILFKFYQVIFVFTCSIASCYIFRGHLGRLLLKGSLK